MAGQESDRGPTDFPQGRAPSNSTSHPVQDLLFSCGPSQPPAAPQPQAPPTHGTSHPWLRLHRFAPRPSPQRPGPHRKAAGSFGLGLCTRPHPSGLPPPPPEDSGSLSPWLPLETRPDSPGEPGMQPRDPCLPWPPPSRVCIPFFWSMGKRPILGRGCHKERTLELLGVGSTFVLLNKPRLISDNTIHLGAYGWHNFSHAIWFKTIKIYWLTVP